MFNRKFFKEVGTDIREAYRTHIFTKALDINGKKFKGYSTYGSKWVTMSVKKEHKKNAPEKGYSYKQAKEGKLFKRQFDDYAHKTSPVLSGDLLRDYGSTNLKVKSKGFEMGWSSHGEKVEWLKGMKRFLTTKEQALPKAIAKDLEKKTDEFIKREGLGPDKTTRHRIG